MILSVLYPCRRQFVALLLSSLSHLAAAQGQGSWGGASGIVLAVLVVVGFFYLLGVRVVWLVARAMGINGALRVVVTILISCAPFAYLQLGSIDFKKGLEAQNHANQDFRSRSEQYIAEKCSVERRVTAPLSLPSGTGIFLSEANVTRLAFTNIPPAVPLTAEMKRNHDRYGTQYPDEKAIEGQFHQPLNWTVVMNPDGVLSQGAAFVEFVDQHGPNKGKKVRMARYQWWRENTAPAELQKVLKPYEEHRFLEQTNPYLTSPVDELESTYELEMRDVSTLEDRKNWVARGQISLTRRSDHALVAEYVGLAAAHYWGPTSSGWWTHTTVCTGPETKYGHEWRPEKFFFEEVVRIEGATMPPR